MPVDKEIFLREYVETRASEKELRKLIFDLLDGIDDLKDDFDSKKLNQDILLWTEKAEFELYKETVRQTELTRQEIATGHSTTPTRHNRLTLRPKPSTIGWTLSMIVVFVLVSLWSLDVGFIVIVAYIFAFLMSFTDRDRET